MWVYFTIVLVFCAAYPIIPRKHIKWLFLALVLALSVMAFFMVPYETDDICNYFNQLSSLRKGGFSTLRRCIQNGDNHWDSLPVCGFFSILSAASRITGCFLPLRYFWLTEVCSGCCGGLRRDTK